MSADEKLRELGFTPRECDRGVLYKYYDYAIWLVPNEGVRIQGTDFKDTDIWLSFSPKLLEAIVEKCKELNMI